MHRQIEPGTSKTKAPTLIRMPGSSNKIMKAWLKWYRPALLQGADHEYIFLNKNGSAPRKQFGAQVNCEGQLLPHTLQEVSKRHKN